MHEITLSDGTKLENLELNGNNFIASGIIEDSVFLGKLGTVVISDGETETTMEDAMLTNNRVIDGRSWFILSEKTEQQKAKERLERIVLNTSADITDMQLALAEIYEIMLGGM